MELYPEEAQLNLKAQFLEHLKKLNCVYEELSKIKASVSKDERNLLNNLHRKAYFLFLDTLLKVQLDSPKTVDHMLDILTNTMYTEHYKSTNASKNLYKRLIEYQDPQAGKKDIGFGWYVDRKKLLTSEQKITFLKFYQWLIKEVQGLNLELNSEHDLEYKLDKIINPPIGINGKPPRSKVVADSIDFQLLYKFPHYLAYIYDLNNRDQIFDRMSDFLKGVDQIEKKEKLLDIINEVKNVLQIRIEKQPEIGDLPLNNEGQIVHNFMREFQEAIQQGKKEEFLNNHQENPILVAWLADQNKMKLDINQLRNGTPEEIKTLDHIAKTIADVNGPSSELMKTILLTKKLLENNVNICLQMIQYKTSSIPQLGIILHPEQSDASLEMRAWNFYQTITSIWNAINDIKDDGERNILIKKLANECHGGLCMEARLKSIDSWYQTNKILIEGQNVRSLLNLDTPLPNSGYESVVWFLNNLTTYYLESNNVYHQKKNSLNKIDPVLSYISKVNPVFTIATLTQEKKPVAVHVPSEYAMPILSLMKVDTDRLREQLIQEYLPELTSLMKKLIGRQASDGIITQELIQKVFDDCSYDTTYF